MVLRIFQAETAEHEAQVRELFWEYLQWANGMTRREFGLDFDIQTMLEENMADLGQFAPPQGRLLLAEVEGRTAGCACLKKLAEGVGEIKRMYVRPEERKQGVGRSLVQALLEEARGIGYARVRLDSARFMGAAHSLYRSFGFQEIEPYPESEIPPEHRHHWVFMELALK